MSRTITPAVVAELASGQVRPAIFFEAQFPSGFLRLWSGLGDISWNGSVWTGAGNLMGIGAIEESADVVATGTTISLSGIPTDLVSLCLADARQGMPGKVWIGFMTAAMAVIADPILAFAGRLDVPSIMDGAERCEIQITYESRLIDLNRSREFRYTHESQQLFSAGDRGFEYVSALQDKEVRWGMGTSVAGQAAAAASRAVSGAMVRNFSETGSLFNRAPTYAEQRAADLAYNEERRANGGSSSDR